MKKVILILNLTLTLHLVGCQNEIDKCVGAIKRDHPNNSEAQARIICLQAASGKQ